MTREEIAQKNAFDKHEKARKLVLNLVTGMFNEEYRKPSGKWHIGKIADATHLHRDTVSKHLRQWEANKDGLFVEFR